MSPKILLLSLLLVFGNPSDAGLIGLLVGYGACQTACNAAWVTCCATAGVAAGTVTAGAGAPAAVMACSALQGVCMASCAAGFAIAPTP